MLASGAGEIVPFGDSAALAEAVCRYIERAGPTRRRPRGSASDGAQLAWPSVAEATAAVLREAVELAPRRRRPLARLDPQLVSMRTDHLLTLVDDVGIVQHANGVIPNRQSGYCVDDVARLAVVALELARRGDEQTWTSIVYRSLAFLQDATDPRARDAQLHGLRPALARRAARRRPRRPRGLGAGRHPLHGVGARRRRSHPPPARRDRRHARTGALAAHRRVHRARTGSARPGPAAARSPGAARATGRPACRRRTRRTPPPSGTGSRTRSATTTHACRTP